MTAATCTDHVEEEYNNDCNQRVSLDEKQNPKQDQEESPEHEEALLMTAAPSMGNTDPRLQIYENNNGRPYAQHYRSHHHHHHHHHKRRNHATTHRTSYSAVQCFQCKELGHKINDCPQHQTTLESSKKDDDHHVAKVALPIRQHHANITCHYCGEPGHIAPECTIKQQDRIVRAQQQKQHYYSNNTNNGPQHSNVTLTHYRPKICRYWMNGHCRVGDTCAYAHSIIPTSSSSPEAPSVTAIELSSNNNGLSLENNSNAPYHPTSLSASTTSSQVFTHAISIGSSPVRATSIAGPNVTTTNTGYPHHTPLNLSSSAAVGNQDYLSYPARVSSPYQYRPLPHPPHHGQYYQQPRLYNPNAPPPMPNNNNAPGRSGPNNNSYMAPFPAGYHQQQHYSAGQHPHYPGHHQSPGVQFHPHYPPPPHPVIHTNNPHLPTLPTTTAAAYYNSIPPPPAYQQTSPSSLHTMNQPTSEHNILSTTCERPSSIVLVESSPVQDLCDDPLKELTGTIHEEANDVTEEDHELEKEHVSTEMENLQIIEHKPEEVPEESILSIPETSPEIGLEKENHDTREEEAEEPEETLLDSQENNIPHVQVPHSQPGLQNKAGENNCFLNVVIQALYNNTTFLQAFRSTDTHACEGQDRCIFCGLSVIFSKFDAQETNEAQEANEAHTKVVSPHYLRQILSVVYAPDDNASSSSRSRSVNQSTNDYETHDKHQSPNESSFSLGTMEDAVEAMDKILWDLHRILSPPRHDKSTEDFSCHEHPDRACIVHQNFGMHIAAVGKCPQCPYRSPVHTYDTMVLYLSANVMHTTLTTTCSFEQLIQASVVKDSKICGNAKCRNYQTTNALIPVELSLDNHPRVLSLGIQWTNDQPSVGTLTRIIESIAPTLDLEKSFSCASSSGAHLVGCFAYYGRHYIAYFFNPEWNQWLVFDDAEVRPIGTHWEDVSRHCLVNRFQPLLLFYQVQGRGNHDQARGRETTNFQFMIGDVLISASEKIIASGTLSRLCDDDDDMDDDVENVSGSNTQSTKGAQVPHYRRSRQHSRS